MKKILIVLVALTMGVAMAAPKKSKFTLTSKTIKEGMTLSNEQVYNGYGCSGKNISPDLQWSNPPKGTKSFALIMHDPDAPLQGGWYHWVVINIPSVKSNFLKNELQVRPVIETDTSFGAPKYGGPCPPVGHGRHRYIFTIYALNTPWISAREDSPPQDIEAAVKEHAIDSASITTYFERK